MNDKDDWGIADTSLLTDADWAIINRLRRIYETDGQQGLSKALRELDLVQYIRVMGAFFPNEVRETLKDKMAEQGLTEEDVREMAKKLNPHSTKH